MSSSVRVNTLTSPPCRWTWIRIPSIFHSAAAGDSRSKAGGNGGRRGGEHRPQRPAHLQPNGAQRGRGRRGPPRPPARPRPPRAATRPAGGPGGPPRRALRPRRPPPRSSRLPARPGAVRRRAAGPGTSARPAVARSNRAPSSRRRSAWEPGPLTAPIGRERRRLSRPASAAAPRTGLAPSGPAPSALGGGRVSRRAGRRAPRSPLRSGAGAVRQTGRPPPPAPRPGSPGAAARRSPRSWPGVQAPRRPPPTCAPVRYRSTQRIVHDAADSSPCARTEAGTENPARSTASVQATIGVINGAQFVTGEYLTVMATRR